MGLWLEMNDTDESVKFIGSNKRCSPGGGVDMARLGVVWGQGIMGRTLCTFLLNFAVNPKLLQKNKVYLKNEESLKFCFKIYVFNPRNWKVAKQNPG